MVPPHPLPTPPTCRGVYQCREQRKDNSVCEWLQHHNRRACPIPQRRHLAARHFLRRHAIHTCLIAVWYSPFLKGHEGKQLSLTLYGKYTDGKPFAFTTDGNWSWALAPATTLHSPHETEQINSRAMRTNWNIDGLPMPMLRPVKSEVATDMVGEYRPRHIRKTYSCRLANSSATTLTYLSPFPFHGWARVTLRGMKPGTQITVNGLY